MTVTYDQVVAYDGGTAQVARLPVSELGEHPPYVLIGPISPGTTLGASFYGWNIYRQISAAPARRLELAAAIRVPPGRSPAEVESQHVYWADREPGWTALEGGRVGDGYDYWVSAVDVNGVESALGAIDTRVQINATKGSWLSCNSAWWLAARLRVIPAMQTSLGARSVAYQLAGRGREITRTQRQRPSKRGAGDIILSQHVGHDQARVLEVIAASGRQMCLSRKLGDRYLGTLEINTLEDLNGARLRSGFEFIVTGDTPAVSDYNLPCGIPLDGTDDLVSTLDNDYLDPGSGSFSFFVSAADITDGGSDYLLSKGPVASGAGYAVRTTGVAGVLEVVVRGASATSTITVTGLSASLFDGFIDTPEGHVIAATYDADAATLTVYIDGDAAGTPATGLTLGAVANTRKFFAGADNDGADAGTAFATMLYRSHGTYQRALTADDHRRLAGYLRGHPGVRAPGHASSFYDARDVDSFPGVGTTLHDLSGDHLDAILVGSPAVRGIPAPLRELEEAA